MPPTDQTSDPASELRRWEATGGHWRVVTSTTDHVVVQLTSCEGELLDELRAVPGELDDVLQGRTSS